jgi:membrane protease YdiL (CAAX protease family)
MATLSDPPPGEPPPIEPDDEPRFPWYAPFGVGLAVYIGLGVFVAAVAAAAGWNSLPDRFTIGATLLQDVLLVGGAVAVAALAGSRPLWALGYRRFKLSRGLWLAVAAFVVFFVFLIAWSQLLNVDQSDDLPAKLGARDSTVNLVGVAVLVAFVAPIAEETFFRGFMFGALRGAIGWIAAAVVTGIVFGLIHAGGTSAVFLVPLAVLGFLLCLLYRRTGSLIPGMGVHAFNNALALGTSLHWQAGAVLALVVGAPALVAGSALAVVRSRR